jgi:RNA recognition motif-containing protein
MPSVRFAILSAANGFRAILGALSSFGIFALARFSRPHPILPRFRSQIERKFQVKNIRVGNLAVEATESEIRSLFEPYGAIKRVTIVRDRESGQPKGFGFVEMKLDSEGDRAITQLNGKETDGRALDVRAARPRIK